MTPAAVKLIVYVAALLLIAGGVCVWFGVGGAMFAAGVLVWFDLFTGSIVRSFKQ